MSTEESKILEKQERGDDVNVKLTVDLNDDSSTKYIQAGKMTNDS